jgi:hypothetical protein
MQTATHPIKVDSQGFLRLPGIFGRVGVLEYPEKGYRKYISAAVLQKAVKGLAGIPVVYNHPPGGQLLTPETASQYTVGAVMSASFDGFYIRGEVIIWDKDAIKAASSSHRALSLGYHQELKLNAGVTINNLRYEYETKSIVYNHLAICERARAGEAVKLQWAEDFDAYTKTKTKKLEIMRKLIVNEAVVEIDPVAYDAFMDIKKQLQVAEKEKTELQAKLTSAMDAFTALDVDKKNIETKYAQMEAQYASTAQDSENLTSGEFKARLDAWAIVGLDSTLLPLDAELSSVEVKRKYLKALIPTRSEAFDSYSRSEITSYWQVASDLNVLRPPKEATDAKKMMPLRDGYSDKDMMANKTNKKAFDAKYPSINQLLGQRDSVGYAFAGHSSNAIAPTVNIYSQDSANVATDEAGTATIRVQKRF